LEKTRLEMVQELAPRLKKRMAVADLTGSLLPVIVASAVQMMNGDQDEMAIVAAQVAPFIHLFEAETFEVGLFTRPGSFVKYEYDEVGHCFMFIDTDTMTHDENTAPSADPEIWIVVPEVEEESKIKIFPEVDDQVVYVEGGELWYGDDDCLYCWMGECCVIPTEDFPCTGNENWELVELEYPEGYEPEEGAHDDEQPEEYPIEEETE
jgi:hypothetical protein